MISASMSSLRSLWYTPLTEFRFNGLSLGLELFGSPTTSNQAVCPFPTLKIGPGESSRSHSADEYIVLDEISEGVRILTELLNGLEI